MKYRCVCASLNPKAIKNESFLASKYPNVYSKVGLGWRLGTAHLLDDGLIVLVSRMNGGIDENPQDKERWFVQALKQVKSLVNLQKTDEIVFEIGRDGDSQLRRTFMNIIFEQNFDCKTTIPHIPFQKTTEGEKKYPERFKIMNVSQQTLNVDDFCLYTIVQRRSKPPLPAPEPESIAESAVESAVESVVESVVEPITTPTVHEPEPEPESVPTTSTPPSEQPDDVITIYDLFLESSTTWGSLHSEEMKRILENIEAPIGADDVFPETDDVFRAFRETSCEDLKIVILGQDPYPTRGHAHGLSFSVNDGVAIPRSLQMIYSALQKDCKIKKPLTGNLTPWARQGVLLLNTALTVKEGEAGAHISQWEEFTKLVLKEISQSCENLIFFLWGAKAKAYKPYIKGAHQIYECCHPVSRESPGFSSVCNHFSRANKFLIECGKVPIDWQI
jgi:uracil-DNA glycosylase